MNDHPDGNRTRAPQRQSALIDPALLERIRDAVAAVSRPWWQGEVVSENGLIYGANTGGSRPPLVWCFQGHAEFAAFARALGPDQPLYGMRSGHMVVAASAENHLHLAMACAAELHALGLAGPVHIGGNCQGALLAQKIAQILMAAGRPVPLLIELNPFLLTPYPGRTALIVGRYDRTNPLHRFHDPDRLLRANLPDCSVDTLPSQHGEMFGGRILALLSQTVRRRMDEAAGAYPGSFPDWSLRAEVAMPPRLAIAAGSLHEVPVTLRNTSETVWQPSRQSGISVGNHWFHSDGSLVQWLDGQQMFDQALPPGAAMELTLLVRAPATPGDYVLKVDVQQAGIMWLSETGIEPAICLARVTQPGQSPATPAAGT